MPRTPNASRGSGTLARSPQILSLAFIGLCLLPGRLCHSATLLEDFSSDPAARGWKSSGDATLFHWNSANQNVDVTWDSSRPNSFFSAPLGTVVTKADDFSLAFDLRLSDFTAGINPQKPNPFQLAVALVNLREATGTNFLRGTGADSPDLVEFSFFPDPGGAWVFGPSITAVLVDSPGTNYFTDWSSGGFGGFSLTVNDLFHIELAYTAADQTLRTTLTRNGQSFGSVGDAHLPAGFQNFHADHVAVCSYNDAGQDPDYSGSILAHGTADNFTLNLPATPLTAITGGLTNQFWQSQFSSLTNWLYTLERTTNFQSWAAASAATNGTGATVILQDTNPPPDKAFYRVRADKP